MVSVLYEGPTWDHQDLDLKQIHTPAYRDYAWRERGMKLDPDSPDKKELVLLVR